MGIEEELQSFAKENERFFIQLQTGQTIFAEILKIGRGFIRINDGASESIVNLSHVMCIRALPEKSVRTKKKALKEKISIFKEFFYED